MTPAVLHTFVRLLHHYYDLVRLLNYLDQSELSSLASYDKSYRHVIRAIAGQAVRQR